MSLLSLHLFLPIIGIIVLSIVKKDQLLYITHLLISLASFLLAVIIFAEKNYYLEHSLNVLEIMSKLIWQLYNENMINIEVANMLLDEHYNRVNKKRY